MKILLTHIGFNSKAVITGNVTQIDLPRNQKLWLYYSMEFLTEVEAISFNAFHSEEVMRHQVVARIVNAYEAWKTAKKKLKEQLSAERKRKSLCQSNGTAQSGSGSLFSCEHSE